MHAVAQQPGHGFGVVFDTQTVAIAPKATPLLANAMEWRLYFNATQNPSDFLANSELHCDGDDGAFGLADTGLKGGG